MSERETHDFMSVDSFSQLPFIRPTHGRDKPTTSTSTAAIRLFGIEVPHEPDSPQGSPKDNPAAANAENGRKFECQYCCRNFPTSQALGGHQNAHKRERQHAKRAHLQSAMAAHHHFSAADGSHMYGLLNYHRLGSVPSPASARFAFEHSPPSHYPSWSNGTPPSPAGARYYGGLGSVSQPINGSPLPGLWRIPAGATVQGGHNVAAAMHPGAAAALPLFGGESSVVGGAGLGGNFGSSSSPPSSMQNRLICETRTSVKDNVSLDLHL